MKSSQAAFDLIVAEEDGGQAYDERHYTHFEWPQGASGPTVGVGYDCGYVTEDELKSDWSGIIDPAMIAALMKARGLRGQDAHDFVRAHGGSVTITWEQAIRQFRDRELPKWESRVMRALPNTELLSPDSFGAIVSLAYNRGVGVFSNGGPRFAEGRAIKAHMTNKQFDKIPADILAMRRLWRKGGALWRRRAHEAALFERGLLA